MHGLLFRTLQLFVQDTYGRDAWQAITTMADLDINDFEPMLNYPVGFFDKIIEAVEAILDKPRDHFFEDLGTYLVAHPNSEGLRRLLRLGGVDYIEFLFFLDDLPDRVRLTVVDLELPYLEIVEVSDERFKLFIGPGLPGFDFVMMGVLRAMADDYGALVLLEALTDESGKYVQIDLIETSFSEGRDFKLAGDQIKGDAA